MNEIVTHREINSTILVDHGYLHKLTEHGLNSFSHFGVRKSAENREFSGKFGGFLVQKGHFLLVVIEN